MLVLIITVPVYVYCEKEKSCRKMGLSVVAHYHHLPGEYTTATIVQFDPPPISRLPEKMRLRSAQNDSKEPARTRSSPYPLPDALPDVFAHESIIIILIPLKLHSTYIYIYLNEDYKQITILYCRVQ